jgi:Fic family protein
MAYHPRFAVTARLVELIEEIAAMREKIMAATVQVAWIPALQKDTRVRNAHSSTAIEGNPLTQEQVRAVEEGREPAATSPRSQREVLNYFAGLRFIEQHHDRRPVSNRDILKLHALIASGEVMGQGQAGRYRDVRVRVADHVPPPPAEVPGLMAELLGWWNRDSVQWSAVITSGILHYRFEEIHPFADGNGRVGRMLALWELFRRGFDTHHIFSMDEFYWEDRPRYYEALQLVRQHEGDLSGWLEYTAQGVHLTLSRVWLRIQRLSAQSGPKAIVLRPRQERLLQMLRDRRSLSPREIREALAVSRQGAIDIVRPLVEAGLVKRVGTRKSGRYFPA